MKVNLTRLIPAVRRKLREAANRAALRLAEKSLRENELRYRRLWESCPDAVLLMDTAARIHFANPAAETLFGLVSTGMANRNFFGLLPEGVGAEPFHR